MYLLDLKNENVSYIGTPQKPIDFLIIGIILCLGHEIVENKQQNLFKQIKSCFSNKKIKIICECEINNQETFLKICNSCFILNNMNFGKEILFI